MLDKKEDMTHRAIPGPESVIPCFHAYCTYHCRFCSQRGSAVGKRRWSLDQIKSLESLWDQAKSVNIGGVGEIGILPDINEIIGYFGSRNLQIAFTSNGRYLDVPYLRTQPLGGVLISLHTVDEATYDNLTGTTGNLPHVMENIRRLAERPRKYGCKVTCVLTEHNVRQAPETARFCRDAGVDHVRFTRLITTVDYPPDIPMKESPENHKALREAFEIMHDGQAPPDTNATGRCEIPVLAGQREPLVARKMPSCLAPYKQMVINLDGQVVPCCLITANRVKFGNVFETPWEDIWYGEKMETFRKSLKDGTNPHCLKYCKNWG